MTEDEVVRQYMPLVRGMAYRLKRHPSVSRDDLISWGLAGLIDAHRRYDPAKLPFVSYASWRVRGAMIDGVRESQRGQHELAENVDVLDPEWRDPADEAARRELGAIARRALATLPAKERQALLLIYFGDLSLREAGERMGLSEARACQLRAQAFARLRPVLADVAEVAA
ncbi:MAG TPA: sigma-70 family RNA polymerase sigma factor [Candidatus Binatia bacterium]|nr:sigma-70 family RNA polymerase sigma factor [Candidatus Binatia bacterium]